MFCGNCGNQIPDGVGFCPNCGAATGAQQAPAVNEAPAAVATKKKMSKNTIIGIVAVAAVVVAVAIILIAIFAGGGRANDPEGVVLGYMEDTMDGDIEAMLDYLPEDFVDALIENEYDGNRKEFIKEGEEEMSDALEMMEEMGIKYSFEVVNVDEPDKDELEEYIEYLNEDLKEYYDIELDIKDAAIVEVEITMKGEVMGEELNETDTEEFEVIKIGKKWYLSPESFDIGF